MSSEEWPPGYSDPGDALYVATAQFLASPRVRLAMVRSRNRSCRGLPRSPRSRALRRCVRGRTGRRPTRRASRAGPSDDGGPDAEPGRARPPRRGDAG